MLDPAVPGNVHDRGRLHSEQVRGLRPERVSPLCELVLDDGGASTRKEAVFCMFKAAHALRRGMGPEMTEAHLRTLSEVMHTFQKDAGQDIYCEGARARVR